MVHENSIYVKNLTQALRVASDFAHFEGLLRANIPELYQRGNGGKDTWCDEAVFKELLLTLRQKIYFFLSQGNLLENNYINLWFLYKQAPLEPDLLVSSLIDLFENAYQGYEGNQKEKYTFAHLLCLLKMINGQGEKAVGWFLSEHIWFDGVVYAQMDSNAQKVKDFCTSCEVSMGEIAPFLKEALNPKRFFEVTHDERMGALTWMLAVFWNLKNSENHPDWAKVVYPQLRLLFQMCIEQEKIEEVMSLHFLMSHIYLNRAQTQEEFKRYNDEVEQKASVFYGAWAKKNGTKKEPKKSSHAKKKIALVKDRIVENSPFKVEFSLLSALAKDEVFMREYELIVYSMAMYEKSFDDLKCMSAIEELGFEVCQVALNSLNGQKSFQSHLKRALVMGQDMQERGVDTMIMASNNMPIGNFLLGARVAPKQIFWSHGNFEYDVAGIDKRISHFPADSPLGFNVFSIPVLEQFYNPQSLYFKNEASKIREQWKGKRILGSIGRLVKVDSDEYLKTVSKILNNNPDTIYLACGTGDVQSVREKLARYGIDKERFIFTGFVNPHLYGYVIDVYLDTFPLHSGESLNEYMDKGGVPVILLPREHPAYKRLEESGALKTLNRIHAFSAEDYVAIASSILQNKEIQNSLKENVLVRKKETKQQRGNPAQTVRDFMNALFF